MENHPNQHSNLPRSAKRPEPAPFRFLKELFCLGNQP
jgi:hypothetical protein